MKNKRNINDVLKEIQETITPEDVAEAQEYLNQIMNFAEDFSIEIDEKTQNEKNRQIITNTQIKCYEKAKGTTIRQKHLNKLVLAVHHFVEGLGLETGSELQSEMTEILSERYIYEVTSMLHDQPNLGARK